MALPLLRNRVKETTLTTGTGAVTPGGAALHYRTFAAAGLPAAAVFPYAIEVPSGPWECGTGTLNANGTISRAAEDSSTGAALALTGEAGTTIALVAVASFFGLLAPATGLPIIATAVAAGLMRPGAGLIYDPATGIVAVDQTAPVALSGPLLSSDSFPFLRGSTIMYATAAQMTSYFGGAAPSVATSATALTGAPSAATAGTAITGVATTLGPSGSTAYAVLYGGGADLTARVAFTGTALPGLTPAVGGSVTIRIYAAPSGGTPLVESAAISVSAAPSALSPFTASVTSSTATLSWAEPGAAPTSRTVQLRTPSGSGSYVAATLSVAATATGATASGLAAGTTYDFQVIEANSTGSTVSTLIGVLTASQAGTAPSTLTGFSASMTGTTAALSWTEPGAAPTSRTVQLRTPSGSGSYVAATLSVAATATGATVSGLADGTTYDFQVTETNAAGSSVSTLSSQATPAQSGPANTLTLGWYNPPPSPWTADSSYGGYSYGNPAQYLTLANAGGAIPTSAANVLYGFSTSATVPPGPADHVVSGTIFTNGYTTGSAHNGAFFEAASAEVAVPNGSAPNPGVPRYFWVSIDNGASWSTYRDGSNVAIPIMIIG